MPGPSFPPLGSVALMLLLGTAGGSRAKSTIGIPDTVGSGKRFNRTNTLVSDHKITLIPTELYRIVTSYDQESQENIFLQAANLGVGEEKTLLPGLNGPGRREGTSPWGRDSENPGARRTRRWPRLSATFSLNPLYRVSSDELEPNARHPASLGLDRSFRWNLNHLPFSCAPEAVQPRHRFWQPLTTSLVPADFGMRDAPGLSSSPPRDPRHWPEPRFLAPDFPPKPIGKPRIIALARLGPTTFFFSNLFFGAEPPWSRT
ncbi:hypothetical protein KM043_009293 [Ampulex compressa]|nr:hypothetical protein KM043_009293 [Ampulex compressa]